MENCTTPVGRYFREFADYSDEGNVPELAARFADVFLAAGPQGAQPVRAGDFALALPKRIKLFKSLGCRSTELISIHESWLDTRYVSVRAEWRFTFDRTGGMTLPVVVASTYILDAGAEPFRILVYLAHGDIMETLKRGGITPTPE